MNRGFRKILTLNAKTLLILSLGIIASFFIIKETYLYLRPISRISFHQFVPTKIPGRFQIDQKRLNLVSPHSWLIPDEVSISLQLTPNSWIIQSKSIENEMSCPASNNHCQNKTSPKGQKYLHELYSNSENEAIAETINFVKEGTLISCSFRSENRGQLTSQEIDDFVDSFEKGEFTGLTVKRMHPGP